MELGLLLLRLTVGLTLASHGAQKLFGWFGGGGIKETGHFLESLRFRPGRLHAVLAGFSECASGILMAIGLLTPLASAIVFAVMLVATVTVHLEKGFFAQRGGYEYALVVALAGLTLAFTGPGSLSLDALLGFKFSGIRWGLAALIGGLIIAGVQLAQRHPEPQAEGVTST